MVAVPTRVPVTPGRATAIAGGSLTVGFVAGAAGSLAAGAVVVAAAAAGAVVWAGRRSRRASGSEQEASQTEGRGGLVRYEVLPAREVMRRWRPGSYEPPWSWADEEADIEARTPGRLEQLRRSLIRNGFDEPVLLGDDGRVWDGHHRIIAAASAGLDIPVEITNRLDHAHPDAA